MNRENFIRTLLPTNGLYALFAKHKNEEWPRQTFHDTVEGLLKALDAYDGYDLYCGVASFKDDSDRKQHNVHEIKAFFLDLDAKDFGSKKEALTQLQAFCKVTKLPKPTLIDSGRGIHVYWLLDKAIDGSTWTKVATKLKGLCVQHGLKADPAVTSDSARVMRIAGTFNHKGEDPVPCRVLQFDPEADRISLEDFSAKIGYSYVPEPEFIVPAAFAGLEDPLSDKLSGNTESSFKVIMQKTQKGKGCAQLRNAVLDSKDLDEPTWRGALSIAVRCVDSSVALRKVSEKHPDYSEKLTKKKADETKGPYTCDMFENLNPDLCKGCPNKGKVKSPIVLGNQLIELEQTGDGESHQETVKLVKDGEVLHELTANVPRPPRGYSYGKEGGVYAVEVDEDGNKDFKVVCKHTLYVVDRTYDPIEHQESLIVRVHMPQDGVRTFILSNAQVSSADKLREELAKKGILSLNQTELRRYIMAWVDHYQQYAMAKKPIRQFGWQGVECTQFVLGETVYTKNGPELALPSPRTAPYNSYFDPRGTLDKWVANLKFWDDPRFVQQQYCMGVGFGSVLMERDATNASILHLYSKGSGIGKTAIVEAIASIWGQPRPLVMNQDDTLASKMNRSEVWHNIPLILDEITNITPQEASQIIYQMSSGQQRSRMNSNANEERVRGDRWSFFCITTANNSILDKVCGRGGKASPEAEAQRVIEMHVNRQYAENDTTNKKIALKFRNALETSCGVAGPVFIQWVINNPTETDLIISKVQEAVDTRAELSATNRFWSAQVTYAIAALVICKKLGLLSYDPKNVMKYAIQILLKENKANVVDMKQGCVQVISSYVAENFSNFLQVRNDSDASDSENGTPFIPPDEKARVKILGRYESDNCRLFLLCGPFKEWCIDRQINYRGLLTDIREAYPSSEIKTCRIGTGTKLDLGSSRTLVIPWSHNDADSQSPAS